MNHPRFHNPGDPVLRPRRFRRGGRSEFLRWALTLFLTGAVAVALLLGSLVFAIYRQARADESRVVDAIVVLGTAQYNGRPSPDLKARLDETLEAYNQGYAPLIVVTGGNQPGDAYTEAETGQIYLTDHGVPESAILLEDRGNDSWASMQGAARLLNERHLRRVLLISDGFHLFRLKLMAKELGLTAYGRAASDSPIAPNSRNEFNYVLREAAGAIVFKLGHLW